MTRGAANCIPPLLNSLTFDHRLHVCWPWCSLCCLSPGVDAKQGCVFLCDWHQALDRCLLRIHRLFFHSHWRLSCCWMMASVICILPFFPLYTVRDRTIWLGVFVRRYFRFPLKIVTQNTVALLAFVCGRFTFDSCSWGLWWYWRRFKVYFWQQLPVKRKKGFILPKI